MYACMLTYISTATCKKMGIFNGFQRFLVPVYNWNSVEAIPTYFARHSMACRCSCSNLPCSFDTTPTYIRCIASACIRTLTPTHIIRNFSSRYIRGITPAYIQSITSIYIRGITPTYTQYIQAITYRHPSHLFRPLLERSKSQMGPRCRWRRRR